MKRILAGPVLGVATVLATVAVAPAIAYADDSGSCFWPEDGDEYPAGTEKEEFWGTEPRPGGRVVHRYRIFRCENGAWMYQGDKYYPGQSDDDDDDDGDYTPILT